jgi:hypothetical protein
MTSLYATVAAGGRILSSQIRGAVTLSSVRSTTQSVTSSTALQNDNQLFFNSIPASTTWKFLLTVLYNGGTTGSSDIKVGWSLPSGATAFGMSIAVANPLGVSIVYFTQATTVFSATNGTGSPLGAFFSGSIIMGSTAGTVQLQWAQNTSNATATTVMTGSDLTMWRTV